VTPSFLRHRKTSPNYCHKFFPIGLLPIKISSYANVLGRFITLRFFYLNVKCCVAFI